jgi:hypothetical protein
MRMLPRSRIYIEALAFDRHLDGLIAEAAKFSVKIVADRSFVAGDGFDVHQLAGKRYSVHAGENKQAVLALRHMRL